MVTKIREEKLKVMGNATGIICVRNRRTDICKSIVSRANMPARIKRKAIVSYASTGVLVVGIVGGFSLLCIALPALAVGFKVLSAVAASSYLCAAVMDWHNISEREHWKSPKIKAAKLNKHFKFSHSEKVKSDVVIEYKIGVK